MFSVHFMIWCLMNQTPLSALGAGLSGSDAAMSEECLLYVQDVADAHRFFDAAGPAPCPSQ